MPQQRALRAPQRAVVALIVAAAIAVIGLGARPAYDRWLERGLDSGNDRIVNDAALRVLERGSPAAVRRLAARVVAHPEASSPIWTAMLQRPEAARPTLAVFLDAAAMATEPRRRGECLNPIKAIVQMLDRGTICVHDQGNIYFLRDGNLTAYEPISPAAAVDAWAAWLAPRGLVPPRPRQALPEPSEAGVIWDARVLARGKLVEAVGGGPARTEQEVSTVRDLETEIAGRGPGAYLRVAGDPKLWPVDSAEALRALEPVSASIAAFVVPGCAADRAGLVQGDVVVAVDGKPLLRAKDVRRTISKNRRARVGVLRGTATVEVEIELE